MGEPWVVNASPVITLAKAGYLHLFDQLAHEVLLPTPVISEILAGPPADPARKAVESGWGHPVAPGPIPDLILEWGLGAGESSVLALALGEHAGLIESAASVMRALRQVDLRIDDRTLRIALERIGEIWPE